MPPITKPSTERRNRQPAIPADIDRLLSSAQLYALHQVESFGWELVFVRRPPFQPTVPVLQSPDHQRFAVLSEDGELLLNPDLVLRRPPQPATA